MCNFTNNIADLQQKKLQMKHIHTKNIKQYSAVTEFAGKLKLRWPNSLNGVTDNYRLIGRSISTVLDLSKMFAVKQCCKQQKIQQ